MKYSITLYVLLGVAVSVFGQENAMVWYFGDRAGLDFNEGNPIVLSDGIMRAEAGCASMCDQQGQLLFYTNGNKVWNRNHELMANGDSLHGSQLRNQNSVIVPKPLSDSLYYLFTVIDSDSLQSFSYSIVNINLENGLGRLTKKNVPVSKHILEKIAAVEHCNNQDYWIVTHGANNIFYCYLLTDQGLDFVPVQSQTGTRPRTDIGYLKISPASDKMVMPINNDSVLAEVFSFNNRTGMVDQPKQINTIEDNTYCSGVEFSPNGEHLFLGTGGTSYELWQFDLRVQNQAQFNSSGVLIASGNNFALQLAPDGKIYIASHNRPYLNVIHKPNESGIACGYQSEAISFIQGFSLMGLPNIVQSWLYKPSFESVNTCFPDSTDIVFYPPENTDSITWNFGDGTGIHFMTGNDFSFHYQFHDTGTYEVDLNIYRCGLKETVTKNVIINPYPVSSLVADTSIRPGYSVVLDAGDGMDSYWWDDGSANRFLTVYNSGYYYVEIGKNGCYTTDTAFVWEYRPVVALPNAFTPNSDGLNDVFKPLVNIDVVDFSMWIVNRRGEIVYRGNHILEGWDGKFKGQICISGTFVWHVTYSYFNELGIMVRDDKKGLVTLIR
ncbi:MAG: hypothetical protein CVT99_09575 [Bacteroidetes bacterium HGW-Bacteroidetes-16]|jgi:gliding motility-associated-like protein|nr:MAG: hypothetical protein CVT99_09575 [Bacteroidetes bacterium HGW-Bacteroidetes-16]